MRFFLCLVIFSCTASFIEGATIKELQRIFKTPKKRHYDNLEILERSNFGDDEPEMQYELVKNPQSVANAQVMLRFGENVKSCGCQDACQCGSPYPYPYPPYPYPPPSVPYSYYSQYYYPPPPSPCYKPPDPTPSTTILQNQNIDNGGIQIVDQTIEEPSKVLASDPIIVPFDPPVTDIVQNQNIDNGGIQIVDQTIEEPSKVLVIDPIIVPSDPPVTNIVQNQNIDNGGVQIIDQDIDIINKADPIIANIFQNENIDNGGVQIIDQDIAEEIDKDLGVILETLDPVPVDSALNIVQNQNIDNGGVQIIDQDLDLINSDLAIIDPPPDDVVLQVTPEDDIDPNPQINILQNQNIDNGGIQIIDQEINLLNDAPDIVIDPEDPSETEVYLDPSELLQENIVQNQNIDNGGIQLIAQDFDLENDQEVIEVRPDPIGRIVPVIPDIEKVVEVLGPSEPEVYLDPSQLIQTNILQNQNIDNGGIQIVAQNIDLGNYEEVLKTPLDPIVKIPSCNQEVVVPKIIPYPILLPIFALQPQILPNSDLLKLLTNLQTPPITPSNQCICLQAVNCPCSQCGSI